MRRKEEEDENDVSDGLNGSDGNDEVRILVKNIEVMAKGFIIGLIVAVVIVAAYIISRLDDKLLKERYEHKKRVKALADEITGLHTRTRKAELERMKAEHLREALQVDYDRLLTDYHLLERSMNCGGRASTC